MRASSAAPVTARRRLLPRGVQGIEEDGTVKLIKRTAWAATAVFALGCGLLLLPSAHDPVESLAGPPELDFVFRPVRSASRRLCCYLA